MQVVGMKEQKRKVIATSDIVLFRFLATGVYSCLNEKTKKQWPLED